MGATNRRQCAAGLDPSEGVDVVSEHVMDLVPYLVETYPESDFAQLEAGGS